MATVLVVAPHPDDEVLGVGGFIRKRSSAGDRVIVLTVSGHLPPLYPPAAYQTTIAEAKKAHEILGVAESVYLEIPATQVHTVPVHELNGKISAAVAKYRPQTVL